MGNRKLLEDYKGPIIATVETMIDLSYDKLEKGNIVFDGEKFLYDETKINPAEAATLKSYLDMNRKLILLMAKLKDDNAAFSAEDYNLISITLGAQINLMKNRIENYTSVVGTLEHVMSGFLESTKEDK